MSMVTTAISLRAVGEANASLEDSAAMLTPDVLMDYCALKLRGICLLYTSRCV